MTPPTRSLTDTFAADDGPMVRVRFHLPPSERRLIRAAGRAVPVPIEVRALIDTGAETTCLDSRVASRLGLPLADMGMTNAPALGGWGIDVRVRAEITVVHPSGDPKDDLVIDELEITELDLSAVGYDALIGRDLLAFCILTYDGLSGTFTLAY